MDAIPSASPVERRASDTPAPTQIGRTTFRWGSRTFLMGVINLTPDSFSGDGLVGGATDPVVAAVAQARQMVDEGADILDLGGESSRPGHQPVSVEDEMARVLPALSAIRQALPDIPLSVDTTKPAVAEAALDAGAVIINDVWGVGPSTDLARLAAEREVALVVMHNRAEPRYGDLLAEVVADLARALERALAAGVRWDRLIVDPGIGFGKTAEHNLALLRELDVLSVLGRPVLLGTSRKSTIGKVLDLPVSERLEGTLATTALGIAKGADIVRVHDVKANARVVRMSDAIIRGGWHEEQGESE